MIDVLIVAGVVVFVLLGLLFCWAMCKVSDDGEDHEQD